MKIVFSDHVRFQMGVRDISSATIKQVLLKPEKTLPRLDETRIAQKSIRWHNKTVLCRVVYKPKLSIKYVITAYITTQFNKYL